MNNHVLTITILLLKFCCICFITNISTYVCLHLSKVRLASYAFQSKFQTSVHFLLSILARISLTRVQYLFINFVGCNLHKVKYTNLLSVYTFPPNTFFFSLVYFAKNT